MKRSLIAALMGLCLVSVSCYNDEIDDLNNRVDKIENEKIATIQEQVECPKVRCTIRLNLIGALKCDNFMKIYSMSQPQVENATAVVDGNSVAFSAMVTGDVTGIIEYGFMLGLSEVLEASLSDLQWKSEYLYYAYVSNGHAIVRSDLQSFKTAPCKLRVAQWFPDASVASQSIPILARGVEAFSVSFSEGADWITFSHGEPPFECDSSGWYYIHTDIEENGTGSPRSCDVIFTCGECGHVTTLSFTQYSL